MNWYRNAGNRTRYHAEGPKWLETGKALCGRSIARPAMTARDAESIPAHRSMCVECAKLAAKTPSAPVRYAKWVR